ncbi:MAG: tyrosine-type recombinase/integrase, partial [Anaerolineae bacterium]|nr:tyrosine-type recombinase/integrase [Anaerolineae bacterium]
AEYDLPNPMKGIRFPQPAKQAPKGVSIEDFIKMLQAAGDDEAGIRDRALLAFLADTGCRLSGLLSLKMENLFLKDGRAIVSEKGMGFRPVRFTHITARLLAQWLAVRESDTPHVFVSMSSGKGLSESGVNQMLKRLKTRAGVKGNINPHAFRHNFARAYLQSGGDLATLAKLLGHKNINTTASFYALFTPDELGEMHRKHSPLRGLDPDN